MPKPERELIARIRRAAGRGGRGIVAGIGDDCAMLRVAAGQEMLVTTDFCLEGVHFRRDWMSAEDVGWRCLTRGLSDIAAMGGEPLAAFLSFAAPADLPQEWVDGFLRGFLKLAAKHRVTLAGGDIAQSVGGVLADVVVVGQAPRGAAVRRSGARPGDLIYVTGELGRAAAALADWEAGKKPKVARPEPRIAVGQALCGVATAMIDVSDGLSTDLGHICKESCVGAAIESERLPAPHGVATALHGGEDYELLFTASPRRKVPNKIAGVQITRIGRIVRGKRLWIEVEGKNHLLSAKGWEHFAPAHSGQNRA